VEHGDAAKDIIKILKRNEFLTV